jgi:hypothetical protein
MKNLDWPYDVVNITLCPIRFSRSSSDKQCTGCTREPLFRVNIDITIRSDIMIVAIAADTSYISL